MGNAIGGGGLLVHGAGEESAEVEEGGTMVADIVDSMEGRPGADQTPPPRVAGGKNSQHRRRRRRSHSMGLSPPSLDYVDADEGESPTSSTLTKSMSFSGGPAGLSSFYERYCLEKKIGTGSFSTVYIVVDRDKDTRHAAKRIEFQSDADSLQQLEREVRFQRELVHPCIVGLSGVYRDNDSCFVVQDLAMGGNLLEFLRLRKSLESEANVRLILSRILSALQYIHRHRIVHRDVKPENILLTRKGDLGSLKLTDFGMAIEMKDSLRGNVPACGTLEYAAPELLLREPFDGMADIWSTGVNAFLLLGGSMPFFGATRPNLYSSIVAGRCSFKGDEWADVSLGAKEFVVEMLQVNPEHRLSAMELLGHPWLIAGEISPGPH